MPCQPLSLLSLSCPHLRQRERETQLRLLCSPRAVLLSVDGADPAAGNGAEGHHASPLSLTHPSFFLHSPFQRERERETWLALSSASLHPTGTGDGAAAPLPTPLPACASSRRRARRRQVARWRCPLPPRGGGPRRSSRSPEKLRRRTGHNGFRAEQRDYDEPEVQAIMWQAVGAGFDDDVILRNVGGRYLRANGRYLRWTTGVSVEDTDNVSPMMYWIVEPIPAREAGMPDLPGPPNRVLYIILGQAWRLIEFVRASAEGLYAEHGWFEIPFRGRSVNHLRDELAGRLAFIDGQYPDGIAMCVRAGLYGRLTPLVVDLTRYAGHAETLQIVVMMSGTPAYNELRYPDVNAI